MPGTSLTDRQLNRATLARQMLLERSGRGIGEAVEVQVPASELDLTALVRRYLAA